MEGIILTDDELRLLEKQFGPAVRDMGTWNSDGTFGYSWISLALVKKAAASITTPDLKAALSRLPGVSDPKPPLIALMETFGHSLIDKLVEVYRQTFFESPYGPPVAENPPEQQKPRTLSTAA